MLHFLLFNFEPDFLTHLTCFNSVKKLQLQPELRNRSSFDGSQWRQLYCLINNVPTYVLIKLSTLENFRSLNKS